MSSPPMNLTSTAPPLSAPSRADAAASSSTTGRSGIGKTFMVSCAHRVPSPNGTSWCGHNWNIVSYLAGELDEVGMVHDLGGLRPVQDFLNATVDHRNLDEVVPGPPALCADAAMRLGGWVHEQLMHCELPFSPLVREVQVVDAWPDSSWSAWQEVARPWRFHAAHWLQGLPQGHKCMRTHGHGYTAGVVMDQGHTGGPIDILSILQPAEQFVRDRLHQQALNEVLGGMNTTAELLARFLCIYFTDQLGIGGIARVLVAETPGTLAEYRP